MAAADGWNIELVASDAEGVPVPEWSTMKLTKALAPERANPHGLRVVKD